jgi:serine protease inhibitor
VPVVLDRPFLYRIIDDQSGATLFIGQVLNPLA